MPALSYTAGSFPFTPFTKILSADVNQCFFDIRTLLNTTKLDSTNIQMHGLIRNGATSNLAAGTANYVVINDSNGDMSEEQYLNPSRGGLGINATPSVGNANQVIVVNPAGTGFALAVTPPSATGNIFNYYRFG